ncbi:MAG: tyrosine-type recombinase/integrase [Pseudomonadota bacterium]
MLTRLKHIKSYHYVRADGTKITNYYHRRTGKRIHGEPGTDEFLQNYMRASSSDGRVIDGTLAKLIVDFKSSEDFSSLKPRTRLDYGKHLQKIDEKWGSLTLEVLEDSRIRKDILQWRDQLAKRSKKQADYTISIFRRILQYGVHIGELSNNRLTHIGKLYKASRTDKIWLPEDVYRFIDIASPELQTALILALQTGQRQGDLIRLTWNAYDDFGLSVTQSKTGRKVYVPCTKTLKTTLDNLPKQTVTILSNSRKKPWTTDGLRTSWHKASKKAGIKDLTFHDLRGTAVTILAEQGCTSIEIATITGHSLKHVDAILDTYASRTKPLAKAAILKLEKSWIGKLKRKNRIESEQK